MGKPAAEDGAEEARRMGARGAGNAPARRDRRVCDALALVGLAAATLLFAQRPSFGGATGEQIPPQKAASVASATDTGAVPKPLPPAIELDAGGARLRVRLLSRAEANRMRAQGLPGEGLQVLGAGRSAAAIAVGDVIVGLCGQTETARAGRLIAALKDSRRACVLAASGGSVTERHLIRD